MNYLAHLLTLVLALNAVSAVFWNVRPKLVKVRLRPPRHHQEPGHHITQQPHHRSHQLQQLAHSSSPPPIHRPAPPPYHVPIKSYRLPSSTPFVKTGGQPGNYIPFKQHFIKMPYLKQNNKIISVPMIKEVELQNFVENPDFENTDSSAHGYLSPSYKGWRPIAKPNYLYQFDNDLKQSSTSNYYVYPTTEIYTDIDGKHKQLYLNTLYRQNVNSLKPLKSVKLKPEYSENKNVAILPPSSFQNFHRNHTSYEGQQTTPTFSFSESLLQTGQSEVQEPVIRKPFPKFQHSRLRKFNTTSGALSLDENPNPNQNQNQTPKLPSRFKISRPRLRGSSGNSDNDAENEGPVQAQTESPAPTQFSDESQQPLDLKGKISSKVRKRVKVGVRQPQPQPQGFVNTEELGEVFTRSRPQFESDGHGANVNQNSIQNAMQVIHSQNRTQNSIHNPRPSSHYHHSNNYVDNTQVGPPPDITNSVPQPPRPPHHSESEGFQHLREVNHPSQPPANTVRDTYSTQHNFNHITPPRNNRQKEREQPKAAVAYNENSTPVYNNDFYLPTDFFQNPKSDGQDPVSFMSMAMGYSQNESPKPKMIRHTVRPNYANKNEQTYAVNLGLTTPENSQSDITNYGNPTQGNYHHNRRPHFVFMNTQNGQRNSYQNGNHASSTFGPPPIVYETTLSPSPHPSPMPYQQNFMFTNNPSMTSRPPPPSIPPPPSVAPTMTFQQFHKPISTTQRNPQQFANHLRYPTPPPPPFDFNVAKVPHIDNNNIQYPEANSIVPVSHVYSKDKYRDPPYLTPNAYSTNEYERIPMEFINHLRPILMNDDNFQTSSPASSTQTNTFSYPKELYQSSVFFDNFFKPFNNPHGLSPNNMQPKDHTKEQSMDVQGSPSNSQIYVSKPPTKYGNSVTQSTSTISPEKSSTSSGSPVHYVEQINAESPPPTTWSKMVGDSEVAFQPSEAKTEKVHIKDIVAMQKEKIKLNTAFSKFANMNAWKNSSGQQNSESTTESSYANPSPLVNVGVSSTNSISDELLEESNTPSSIVTTERPLMRKVIRTRTSSVSEKSSKIVKRRPIIKMEKQIVDRKRFYSTRLRQKTERPTERTSYLSATTHRPRRVQSFTTEQSNSHHEFDSTRVRPKRRRIVFRKPIRSESTESTEVSNTSSLPHIEDVTYGENKWFQVPSSTEDYDFTNIRIRNGKEKDDKFKKVVSSNHLAESNKVSNYDDESVESSSEGLIESKSTSPKILTESVGDQEDDNLSKANDANDNKSMSSTE